MAVAEDRAQPVSATSLPQSASAQSRGDSRLWLQPRAFLVALGVWLVAHLAFCATYQLVPDEAYYWVWSRHLAMSYFDHPPMVAYLIRLGTALLGQTELGVRFMMTLLTASALFIIAWTARRVIVGDRRASAFVAVMTMCSPIFTVIGFIATPDTPAFFFQAAALAIVLSIFVSPPPTRLIPPSGSSSLTPFDSLNRRRRWLLFGALLGFALISKYTSGLLGVAVLMALLWSAEGRRHLRTPWPWLGAALSAAVSSPVIWWNARHNWISFRFQLDHSAVAQVHSFTLRYLGDYIAGQAAVCTPVLFGLCLFVLAVYWFRKDLAIHLRILLLSATVPLVVVGISALHERPYVNWPVFAYLPATLLVGFYFSENWAGRRANLARLAVIVALICTVVIHLPQPFWAVAPRLTIDRWDDLFGWRELAREVARRNDGLPVITSNYQDSSELSFYLPNHPMVWPLRSPQHPTEFEFLPGYRPPGDFERLIVMLDAPVAPGIGLPAGFAQIEAFPVDVTWRKHVVRRNLIVLAGRQNLTPQH